MVKSMTSTTWETAAALRANWLRTSTAPVWHGSKAVKERLGTAEQEPLMPHDLINQAHFAALKEFLAHRN